MLDGYVTDYVALCRDVSAMYRWLLVFEDDEKRKTAMMGRRVAELTPILDQVVQPRHTHKHTHKHSYPRTWSGRLCARMVFLSPSVVRESMCFLFVGMILLGSLWDIPPLFENSWAQTRTTTCSNSWRLKWGKFKWR